MMKTILVIIFGGLLLGGCDQFSSSQRYELVYAGKIQKLGYSDEALYLLDTKTGKVWMKVDMHFLGLRNDDLETSFFDRLTVFSGNKRATPTTAITLEELQQLEIAALEKAALEKEKALAEIEAQQSAPVPQLPKREDYKTDDEFEAALDKILAQ
jgi:hypothetical protein